MDFPRSPDLAGLLAEITIALRSRRIPFMVIGGQAVLLHGHPRLTEDIDITLGVDPGALGTILDACDTLGLEPLPEDPEDFVRDTFVLPAAHPRTRQRVDFIFSSTPYERQAIERAVTLDLAGTAVPFASAEDLLIHKLFAGRPRDHEDARAVVRRKGEALDWEYLRRWAREFAAVPGREGMPDDVARLRGGEDPA